MAGLYRPAGHRAGKSYLRGLIGAAMRVVVTGAGNPFGRAIVHKLLAKGHMVRLFGGGPEVVRAFEGEGTVQWHPGDLRVVGSIEPVLAEREVLVHAATMDEPHGDRTQWALGIERGAVGCRYGAERELLDQFIHLSPARPGRFAQAHQRAVATVESCRKVEASVVTAVEPESTADEVLRLVEDGPHFGRYPGREKDAVAA